MRLCPACAAALSGADWACGACGWRAARREGIPILAPALDRAELGFDPQQFEVLFSLESANFWFRARNALILWALRRYFPGARSLLELGCGTGFVSAAIEREFPQLRIVATEVFAEGAALARRRLARAEVVQLDARALPFESEFDVAGAFDVVEHIAEDEQVFAELARSLAPGGGLVLTVPQHRWLWTKLDAFAHHQRRYERRELAAKLRKAGFEPLRFTSFTALLLPALVASRLRIRWQAELDPMAEFRLSRWTNALLETVLAVERGMVRAGISFPAGGSLLAVARKA